MPQIDIEQGEYENIVEILRHSMLCEKAIDFDDIVYNQFKILGNDDNLPTIDSEITHAEKRKIWRDCRHSMQRLLLLFLENEELNDELEKNLNDVIIQLGEPIVDLETEGEILLQVREYDPSHRYFRFELNQENNILNYNIE